MITNERQYRTTRSQADRLAAELGRLEAQWTGTNATDELIFLQRAAIEGQLSELRSEVQDYEDLRSGKASIKASDFDELPTLLIRARIASGLTQADLGAALGLAEQQIQRYESSRYAGASMTRLAEVAAALGLEFEASALASAQIASVDAIVKSISDAGIDAATARRRLIPPLSGGEQAVPLLASRRLARVASRVFGADYLGLLSGKPLAPAGLASLPAFKLSASADQHRAEGYAAYAGYLVRLVAGASHQGEGGVMPEDPLIIREAVAAAGGDVSFLSLVRYAWSLGIAVLPLADSGYFHAAAWRIDGRSGVALKQRGHLAARWAFDLAHELGHLASRATGQPTEVIDVDDPLSNAAPSEDEARANEFAAVLLLGQDADAIARRAVSRTGGSVERLKGVLPAVAQEAGVDVGALAFFLAYRLSLQGIDWWGAATNLQPRDVDPWSVARDELLARVDFSVLDPLDRELLMEALRA